jgi:AbrB family looped-hinge helix DNA binding protein
MTATLSVDTKRQLTLPKRICEHARIRPGSKVRISQVDGGLLLSPVESSWEAELQAVIKATGYPSGPEPKDAAKRIKETIRKVRKAG